MAKNVLNYNLSEPLNGVTTAKVDINAADANLTIGQLAGDEQLLASGVLQYHANQAPPTPTMDSGSDQASLTLRGGGARQPWFHFPWAACNAATEWQIHLNPTVSFDITAHSGGGNVKLDLSGMVVTHLSAATGGGNMDVVLPANAAHLDVTAETGAGNVSIEIGTGITGSNNIRARSGAGNVVVCIPDGVAALIHATTGLGKVIIAPRFVKTDKNTYRSTDYDVVANRVEITAHSGAGNVSIDTR